MNQTIEATIDEHGIVHLREAITLSRPHRAIITILEEEVSLTETPLLHQTALLREIALAEDWARPEEDAARFHLQSVQ